jgi:adenine-specific DNA-methyltransferase
MLSATELKQIFEKRYDRKEWINVLRENFGLKEIFIPKSVKINADQNLAAEYFIIGRLITKDEREIGIYEVPVNSAVKIERNKVGLRNLLKEVYANDVDGAFVVFDQKKKWRFSYVSEISVRNEEGKREKKKTDPKRYTYLMGEGERCKTASDRFTKLKTTTDLFGEGITLKAIEDAFSVEKLSKNFFDEYRRHYGFFTKYLTGKDENNKETGKSHAFLKSVFKGNEKEARDFIKKMLGRIVFLYFLEKKGWLGVPEDKSWGHGDENFLSNLFNDCNEQENFYQQVLVPLYFSTLNEERTNDLFKIRASLFRKPGYNKLKIPYLNGGLFDDDEKHTDNLVFPKELFKGLFDFFDQYNFTVYEDSPDEHTVAVDPEMLGHIFENLLEDNKDKGAYYTPKEIVHYMCRESLIEYLYTKLNPEQTESFTEIGDKQTDMFGNKAKTQLALEEPLGKSKEKVGREIIEKLILHHEASEIIEYDEVLLKALKEVKVCDPAIGSGAFPMGLLLEIFHLIETLYNISPDVTAHTWKLGSGWNPAKVKEEIIQNSIFGVDIEKGAVDIARLRFWLSLIVDENTPRPLPNLDYKIVVGDSLLSKFEDEVIDIDWTVNTSKGVGATKEIMKEQELKLYDLQHKQHLYFHVKGDKTKLQHEIRNLKIDILINQLTLNKITFNQNNPKLGGFAPTPKEIQKNLENEIISAGFDKTIAKLKKLKENKATPLHFFDWKLDFPEVMNEKVIKDEMGFDIVIGNPPYKMIQPNNTSKEQLAVIKQKYDFADFKIDLFHLFFQLPMKILKEAGTLTYIAPSTLLYNFYAEKLRTWLNKRFRINKILIPTTMVFDADVHTAIYLMTRTERATSDHQVLFTVELEKILAEENSFQSIKQEFLGASPGGAWNLLISNENYRLIKKISSSKKLGEISKINRGLITGDREAFFSGTKKNNNYIPILTGSDILRYSHVEPKEFVLFKKPKGAGGCWDEEVHLASHKICIRQIGVAPTATLIEKKYAVTGNIFTIICDEIDKEKQILGIVNSKIIKYYWKLMFHDFKTSFPQVTIFNLSQIPIVLNNEKNLIRLVDKVLKSKAGNSERDTSELEKYIDVSIYKLYKLTYEEACTIEGKTDWMTYEEYGNFEIE